MTLVDQILTLHPSAVFYSDYIVARNVETGVDELLKWNEETLGPRPTDAMLAAVPPPPITALQASLCAAIDGQASTQRGRYISSGTGQEATYLLKQTQAVQALAAQMGADAGKTADQLAAAYAYLANEIGITVDPTSGTLATDVYGVARSVMAVLQVWQPINLKIEAMRLKTKAAINAATTAAAAQAAHDAAVWP